MRTKDVSDRSRNYIYGFRSRNYIYGFKKVLCITKNGLPSIHAQYPQHQVTQITRAHRAMINFFRQAAQWFWRGAGLICYRRQYTVHLLWWLLAVTAELVQGLAAKIAMIFHSRFHRAMLDRTMVMLDRTLVMLDRHGDG